MGAPQYRLVCFTNFLVDITGFTPENCLFFNIENFEESIVTTYVKDGTNFSPAPYFTGKSNNTEIILSRYYNQNPGYLEWLNDTRNVDATLDKTRNVDIYYYSQVQDDDGNAQIGKKYILGACYISNLEIDKDKSGMLIEKVYLRTNGTTTITSTDNFPTPPAPIDSTLYIYGNNFKVTFAGLNIELGKVLNWKPFSYGNIEFTSILNGDDKWPMYYIKQLNQDCLQFSLIFLLPEDSYFEDWFTKIKNGLNEQRLITISWFLPDMTDIKLTLNFINSVPIKISRITENTEYPLITPMTEITFTFDSVTYS